MAAAHMRSQARACCAPCSPATSPQGTQRSTELNRIAPGHGAAAAPRVAASTSALLACRPIPQASGRYKSGQVLTEFFREAPVAGAAAAPTRPRAQAHFAPPAPARPPRCHSAAGPARGSAELEQGSFFSDLHPRGMRMHATYLATWALCHVHQRIVCMLARAAGARLVQIGRHGREIAAPARTAARRGWRAGRPSRRDAGTVFAMYYDATYTTVSQLPHLRRQQRGEAGGQAAPVAAQQLLPRQRLKIRQVLLTYLSE